MRFIKPITIPVFICIFFENANVRRLPGLLPPTWWQNFKFMFRFSSLYQLLLVTCMKGESLCRTTAFKRNKNSLGYIFTDMETSTGSDVKYKTRERMFVTFSNAEKYTFANVIKRYVIKWYTFRNRVWYTEKSECEHHH